ncbi:MAG: HD family phosphohydrolase [Flavobacteriaceae bacterium]
MSRFSFDAQRLRFLLFSIFLVAGSVGLILWIFPSQRAFNYEYAQGRPWRYETLYAPFDFSIKKTEEQLKAERETAAKNKVFYFDYDDKVVSVQTAKLKRLFQERIAVETISNSQSNRLESQLAFWLDSIQRSAVFGDEVEFVGQLKLIRQNQAISYPKDQAQSLSQHKENLKKLSSADFTENELTLMRQLLSDLVVINARLNQALTESAYQSQVEQISMTRGLVPEGSLIVAKGEIIEADNFQILESLKYEYQSTQIEESNTLYIFLAYSALVSLVLILLMLYLRKYRRDIFENSNQLAFVYINIVLMVLITTLLVDIDERFVYLSPLSILPLVLKNFFDARVALFTHILTILIIAMTVSNAYEFVFLQIVAGVVVMIGSNELQKRTNLFAAAFQITVVYLISYVAFHGLNQGGLRTIDYQILLLFVLNGMITLFAQPLIYLFEKLFGLVSDVSLLELSDTNSKLLKELSEKAPGTFNHSLQVANLCEASANAVGANSLLLRVGALYHDIGKMAQAEFFTENQILGTNPHEDLEPQESADIIRRHVIRGIEIARKHNIPDRIIDFIRSHHGNSLIYYFYKKELELNGAANEDDFRYAGPTPFSKETAILMMCDAVEAASKSLNQPTYEAIDAFVERIIDTQVESGQFDAASITLKEIEQIKKVLKKKLTNIYHVRIEYPE